MDAVFFINRKEKSNKYPDDKERKRKSKRRLKGKVALLETD